MHCKDICVIPEMINILTDFMHYAIFRIMFIVKIARRGQGQRPSAAPGEDGGFPGARAEVAETCTPRQADF